MTSLREVMAKDPITIGPDATVAEAAAVMVRSRIGSLLARDGDAIIGILTERDVMRAAGAGGDLLATRVRDWMTSDPTTAPADQDVEEAAATMLASGFRHLPVTDGTDEVRGIVSLRALFSAHIGGVARSAQVAEARDSAPDVSPTHVHERRERMFEATRALQERSQAPVDDPDQWRRDLAAVVDVLAGVVADHIDQTEALGGFFEELVSESGGRLSAAVHRLGREHERSTQLVAELRAAIEAGDDTTTLRQDADELFAQLEAHRHRGSDLLWQAYGTEIGGDG